MKNLAGETQADLYILDELNKAGIEIIESGPSKEEVPYTLTGKLGDWDFTRAWYYWEASVTEGIGLPLDIATKLHERKYLVPGESEYETYGQVIRVAGHCGCPPPSEWAFPSEKDLNAWSQKSGKNWEQICYGDLAKLCNEGTIKAPRFVSSYHIDTQEGLNAFASTIRDLHNIVSTGNDPDRIQQLRSRISALYTEWAVFQQQDEQQEGVEWLKKRPIIQYDDKTITELIVAIRNGHEIVSIGKKWTDDQHGWRGIAQHFFDEGQIVGFNYGNFSGPGQVVNRGPEIDDKLRPHYEELRVLRPQAANSLEYCMQELEKPGPEYTGRPHEPLTVKIPRK